MDFLFEHLPALVIVAPLICAPLCVVLRGRETAFAIALAASWFSFACACMLASRAMSEGVISYELGGWPPPIGIEYRVDALNALVLLVVSGIGAVVAPYARRSISTRQIREDLFYTTYLLCLTGLMGVVITGDAFNLFVFLEISSLSSYVLIALGSDRRALTASYQYLIMGTIGATFIVIAIGLLYQATGSLNMADIAERLPGAGHNRTIMAAFGFLVVGAALKIALFPLHQWLPNAYAYAPDAVSAFLAATATKVSIYVLVRFLFTIFGVEFSFEVVPAALALTALSVAAMFVASIVACFQTDVKRMLAYSSVAQVGYIVLGVSFVTALGVQAGLLHLFNHALMKGALFLVLGAVIRRTDACSFDSIAGLGARMPWTAAALAAGGLSLIGVPLTAGFVSKWHLVLAAVEKGWWPVAALIVASSLIAVIYVWRIVEAAYFRPAPAGAPETGEAPLGLLVPAWVLVAANYWFGIETSLPVGMAGRAAATLMGMR